MRINASTLYRCLRSYSIWLISLFLSINSFASSDSYACITPFNVQLQYQALDSAIISWTDFTSPGDFIEYQYTYHVADEAVDYDDLHTSSTKSATLSNLQPGRSYYFYVRTACDDEIQTNFTSAFLFHTAIDNKQACEAFLVIPDNSCASPTNYKIAVEESGQALGQDIFINSIELTVQHDWPADLELSLISPSGVSIPLFSDFGVGTSNIGDPIYPCENSLVLDMNACERISSNIPLIGTYKPIGNLENLYDGSDPNGLWSVQVCDDALGQTGTILFAALQFVEMTCSGPDDLYFSHINASSAEVIIPAASCDSLEISYMETTTGSITTIYVPCTQDTITLSDLTASTTYMLEFSAMCEGSMFSVSCPKMFETYCSEVDLFESFDNAETCIGSCQELCIVSSFWQNLGPAFWKIKNGSTATVLTGPTSDASGIGKYAYIEASDTLCRQSSALLVSGCMTITETSVCHFGLSYHMLGNDISDLSIQISIDQQQTCDTLWIISGNQGESWQELQLDLSDYASEIFQLRIVSSYPTGNFGDIAIDNIRLSGVDIIETDLLIYRDLDDDGYGTDEEPLPYCGFDAPEGYSFLGGDCNDENPAISPGVAESPCNLIDDDCNGLVDDNVVGTLNYEIDQLIDQTCLGINNGAIAIHATGGSAPYSYAWVGLQDSDSIVQQLSAGYYQAIVTDAAGCMIVTDSIEIDIIQQFDYLISSINNALCQGISNGGISIFHEEFNAPYQYEWSNGSTAKDLASVGPGFYSLTITDVNNCVIETTPIEVYADKTIEIALDTIAGISCAGRQDGVIDISISNEKAPASISWNNLEMTDSIYALEAGTYHVFINDADDCIQEASFTISEPAPLNTAVVANDPVTCYGENNGKLQVASSGGTAPYSYQWNNGSTSSLNDNLTAGEYRIDVMDANGCQDSLTNLQLFQPDSILITVENISPAICKNNDGSIEISVVGGTGQYRFFWPDSISTGLTIEQAAPGSYDVTVLDAFNCKSTLEAIGVPLIETTLLVDTLSLNDLSCYGNQSGTANFQIINPTELPLSFIVDNDSISFAEMSIVLNDLAAGSYSSEIIDANGCSTGDFVWDISQPDSISITNLAINDNLCYGDSSGSISIEVLGGSPAYQFQWSDGNIDSMRANLSAGTYNITIEDANGCLDSMNQIVVNQPQLLELDSIIHSDLSCYATQDGSIEMIPAGGTFPYTFAINNNPVNSAEFNLPAGVYHVKVTDKYDCLELLDTIIIDQPDSISITIDSIKPSFCGNNNGFIQVAAIGGTGKLSYAWSAPSGDGAFAQNVLSGNYSVTVHDERGCEAILSDIEVDSVTKNLVLEIPEVFDASCFESEDGFITYELSGDNIIPPYDIYINSELISSSAELEGIISNLSNGVYSISIEEGDGCVDSIADVKIDSPSEIFYNLSIVSPISCYGDTNAIVAVAASGGVGDFEFLWTNEAEGDTLINQGPGLLACAIVDGNNCVRFTDTILILEPPLLEVTVNSFDATNENNDGAIYVEATGGTAPYSYIWDPELPTHVDTLEALSESTWNLEVIDSRGCSFDTIIVIDRIVGTTDQLTPELSIFPNPASAYLILRSDYPIARFELLNSQGTVLQNQINTRSNEARISTQTLVDGFYILRVFSDDGRVSTAPFVKLAP